MLAKTGFKCKAYPNGEFTIGYVPPHKFEPEPMKKPKPLGRKMNILRADPGFAKWRCWAALQKIESEPIDLSIVPNSTKRGLNGITSHGARTVRNAAYILQERFGRQNLSFVTLTVPGVTRDEQIAIASQWSSIVHAYHKELKRELIRNAIRPLYVSVTEIQPRRFATRGELGLHLHVVFCGRQHRYGDWAIPPSFHRQVWGGILRRVLGREFYDGSLENVQMVKKSAEGYLGKYMSKGTAIIAEVVEEFGEEVIPSSWWSCELSLRRRIKQLVRVSWDDETNIVELLPELDDMGVLLKVKLIMIPWRGEQLLIGFSGRWDMNMLQNHMSHLYNQVVTQARY